MLLFINFGQAPWDRRVVIVADLELEFRERNTRKGLRIPLVARHRREVYVP